MHYDKKNVTICRIEVVERMKELNTRFLQSNLVSMERAKDESEGVAVCRLLFSKGMVSNLLSGFPYFDCISLYL